MDLSDSEIYNIYQLAYDYRKLENIKSLLLEILLQNQVLIINKNSCKDNVIENINKFVKTGLFERELISQSFWEENYEKEKNINFQETLKLLEIFK